MQVCFVTRSNTKALDCHIVLAVFREKLTSYLINETRNYPNNMAGQRHQYKSISIERERESRPIYMACSFLISICFDIFNGGIPVAYYLLFVRSFCRSAVYINALYGMTRLPINKTHLTTIMTVITQSGVIK